MSKTVAAVFAFAALAAAQQIPRPAPEFTIQMPGGKNILLSQYKGKPVVLAFILTTCPHCQYTTGLLTKLQNEFSLRGLKVLECAVNPGADTLTPAFVQQFKPNFPVGYNFDQDYLLTTFLQHNMNKVPSMPIVVFIDRKGMIRAQYEGSDDFISSPKQEDNLRGEIQKLLAVK